MKAFHLLLFQFVPPDVHTICMGLAASMGSFILVGGELGLALASLGVITSLVAQHM